MIENCENTGKDAWSAEAWLCGAGDLHGFWRSASVSSSSSHSRRNVRYIMGCSRSSHVRIWPTNSVNFIDDSNKRQHGFSLLFRALVRSRAFSVLAYLGDHRLCTEVELGNP